ncbi:FAD-dependent monooxygenase [Streptomyces sp. NRRL F-5135]|uniref:FAD-dependent monooxygenase n=1 Tax=Streptomyces sp. NRRL F-5135 TaxID=1463858 RepID=UPI0007C5B3B5|nr:FAD-dependent monooxygenase [Streptomyces sp. NRRL F-5135]
MQPVMSPADAVVADVIVVGGGPVGMLLAAELAGFGVDTLLLESKEATDEQPKAGTVHARAAQSLARRGYQSGTRPAGATRQPFHFAGLPGLSIEAPGGEPAPVLKRAQAAYEREFEAAAVARGARILRRHRVVDLAPRPPGVRVTAEAPDGVRTFDAAYLIGADGARSTVRARCGFPVDTSPASVSALMGLVRLTGPARPEPGWQRTPRGWIISRPDADGRHLVRTLDCTRAHPDRHAPVTLAELRGEVAWIADADIGMDDPLGLTRFSDFSLLTRRFRQDRVFLVGDAAHTHFPVGGQGMSTGLLDALNLAWKLAHAVHGRAGEHLLGTYDSERRPVASRLVDNTRAQLALMRPGPETDALRSLMAEVLETEDGRALLSGMISAQETSYRPRSPESSAWEGRFLPNLPLVTEDEGPTDVVRLLRDGRPLLLLASDADASLTKAAESRPDTLRTVRVRAETALPSEALLVRPDGYVGWAADGDDLEDALTDWFGTR